MSVVLQIYAIIVTLSLIIVLSFYLLHRREVTRLSQKLQTLLHSFTHAELTLDFPSSDITDLVNALNELLRVYHKADASISSKDFYEIYRMWCEENSLAPLKARRFSDAMIANAGRFNLEHCNNITNSAGRRVWGFMGVEAVARPHINGFYDVSPCTYVPEDWRD